ncbi:Rdx family-domain-containing protein [Neurospora crassa]|nr:Rdx family-domain-containing protein [Neurospora crassa]
MLRAAYYAQELLSTFSTSLGEVALQPSTGGTFIVDITYAAAAAAAATTATTLDNRASTTTSEIQQKTIWDRKTDGGFPETKELKRRVRDVIQPERNLGHVDRDYHSKKQQEQQPATEEATMEAITRTNKSTEADAAPQQQSTSNNKTECADCDNWMNEETYKGGDFEGRHAGGSGSRQSGEQSSKTTGEGTGTDTRGGSGEKKTADSSWMTEETYKDLEGGH